MQHQRARSGDQPHGADDAAGRRRAGGERNDVGRVHPGDSAARQLQARLPRPATVGDRARAQRKEPVVRAVGDRFADGQAVGLAGVRRVVVQDNDGGMRAIERIDNQRPDGARGVGPDNRFDDRITDQLSRQPGDVAIRGRWEPIGRRVRSERAHAPGRLFGQRVRNEPDYVLLPFHAQADASAWRGAHRESDSLTGRKGQRVGRSEARRVDPGDGTRRWTKRLRDRRHECGLAQLRPRAGARDDVKMRLPHRVLLQRHPCEPAATRVDRHRAVIDRERGIAAAASHTAENEIRVLRLNRVGGVGIDDRDCEGLVRRRWCGGTGFATRCRRRAPRCGKKKRGRNKSHVAQATAEQ